MDGARVALAASEAQAVVAGGAAVIARLGWRLMGIRVPEYVEGGPWSWRWTVYFLGANLNNDGLRVWRWQRMWPA